MAQPQAALERENLPLFPLEAKPSGGVLIDHSAWGCLQISGESVAQEFLHNQSTQNIKAIGIGEGCYTAFVNATAQILDLTSLYATAGGYWLVTSPPRTAILYQHLARFALFTKGVSITQPAMSMLRLIGEGTDALLQRWGIPLMVTDPEHNHGNYVLADRPVLVAVGNGLGLPGYTLLMAAEHRQSVWQALLAAGATVAGGEWWEHWRIRQGRPAADQELTLDYNPLEAGLWRAIALDKGCYIGQEVLAKQVTYHRIRQKLWGIHLSCEVPVGSQVMTQQGEKLGLLTSLTALPKEWVGLAYLRSKGDPYAGMPVEVEGAPAYVMEMPFLSYPA
ncbi:MAG: folate-binding protein [Cyanobacteriota bacterium]|nr:folate-binding protein [Cyanobacteriota bacterium]